MLFIFTVIPLNIICHIKRMFGIIYKTSYMGERLMNGLRSVTLWTKNLEETESFFNNILCLNTLLNKEKNILHVGDANLAPGTRIIYKLLSEEVDYNESHFYGIGLRVPTDLGLTEYQQQFDKYEVHYEETQQLNGRNFFKFYDNNGHAFFIISDENNHGVPLGTAYDHGPISPIHKVQGIGPIMLKSPETNATGSLLKNILDLQLYAEYKTVNSEPAIVFNIGAGGNGGELHLVHHNSAIKSLNPPIERVAITIDDTNKFETIIDKIKEINLQHQMIQHEEQITSIFIRDIAGIIITLTLDTLN